MVKRRRPKRIIRPPVRDPVAINMRRVPRELRHSLRIFCQYYGWSVEELLAAVAYAALRRAEAATGPPWTGLKEILAYRRRYGNGRTTRGPATDTGNPSLQPGGKAEAGRP
jgi:hypothetical protein